MENSQNLDASRKRENDKEDRSKIRNKLILVVDDEQDILTYLKLILQKYDYDIITARNGKNALDALKKSERVPDLIISDIKMPIMDGYKFFETVSSNPKYLHVPFIFLSALDEPEDIRLGKLLGVDDYLVKPVNKDDLLATIEGKIIRNMKRRSISQKFDQLYSTYDSESYEQISEEEKGQIFLLRVDWDDIVGPHLVESYPDEDNLPLEKIGIQLFNSINSIYGHKKQLDRAEGVLINLKNFNLSGYAYFDAYKDEDCRGGEREFMFAVIAPQISYYNSLSIKNILKSATDMVSQNKKIKFKKFWKKITDILIV
jgi:CheY-like chemotaxis protein